MGFGGLLVCYRRVIVLPRRSDAVVVVFLVSETSDFCEVFVKYERSFVDIDLSIKDFLGSIYLL